MKIATRVEYNHFDRIASAMPNRTSAVVERCARRLRDRVVIGMAASPSPSPPGAFPGVDTGALMNSITAEPVESSGLLWVVYTDKDYGAPLEYGTVRMAPRPFFTPASEAEAPIFQEEMSGLERLL